MKNQMKMMNMNNLGLILRSGLVMVIFGHLRKV